MDSLALHFLIVVPCASVIKLEPQNLIDVSFCFSAPIRFATTTGILFIRLLASITFSHLDFSLAIYPWPQQLIYDDIDSLQVIYWGKFCKKYNCKNFYNFFEDFFQLVDEKSLNYVLLNYYFYTDIHFNRNGNNIIAEKLIKDIN